jgi:flagellar hook-length control protein FliK
VSKRPTADSSFKVIAEPAPQMTQSSASTSPQAASLVPNAPAALKSAASAQKGATLAPTAQGAPSSDAAQAATLRGLAAAVQQRGGSVTLRLSPESLGNLKIEMSLDRGMVTVDLRAATPEAHELLSQSLGTLRSSLEARGLNVERLNVHLAPTPQPPSGSGTGGDQQQPSWREDARSGTDHDAGGGASRGRDDSNQSRAHGGAEPETDDPEVPVPFAPAFVSTFRLALDAVA